VSIFERLPAFVIAGLLAASLVFVLLFSANQGERARANDQRAAGLGSLETMASGLLGLLLAFNFTVAQSRFDARQQLIVSEADAIGTAFLRCSVLSENDRRTCRSGLRRYAELRIIAYEAYERSGSEGTLRAALAEGSRIQNELWTVVARDTRANPTPANALLMSALNAVIDLDADRRASIRIQVPGAVTAALVFACLAWAVLLGYSSGVARHKSRTAWVVVALLISVVFGVAIDLDRPRSGFVTTAASEQSVKAALRAMETPPVD